MASKGKNSKPFLRGKRGIYYCWVDGHLRSLRTKKPRIAEGVYRQLLIDLKAEKERERERKAPRALTVRECFDLYLEYAKRFDPATRAVRERHLGRFAGQGGVGDLPHDRLTHDHLLRWIGSDPSWSSSYRRVQVNGIVAAFNFCVKRRHIAANPLQGVEKPRFERRRRVISPADSRTLRDAADGPFLAILTALAETGARPSELCRADVADYRSGTIVLKEHKEDERGEDRVIHLTAALRGEVEGLIGPRTEGPIWRNSWGRRWTPDALYKRFRGLRKSLGLGEGVFPYAMRHRFASDAINDSDANPAIVAKLLGHKNLNMLMSNYFKEDPEAAQRAIEEIRKAKEKDG